MTIVTKWLELHCDDGRSVKSALDELAEAAEIKITHSRLREWERGERGIPPAAYNYMLSVVLKRGVNEEQYQGLYSALSMPVKQE